jgi:hypothetical protein
MSKQKKKESVPQTRPRKREKERLATQSVVLMVRPSSRHIHVKAGALLVVGSVVRPSRGNADGTQRGTRSAAAVAAVCTGVPVQQTRYSHSVHQTRCGGGTQGTTAIARGSCTAGVGIAAAAAGGGK